MPLHAALKIMRQSKHWTQEETADKLGWGVNTYAQIERGEVDIKCDKLRKFAELMGVDIKELLTLSERPILNFVENNHYHHYDHHYDHDHDHDHDHNHTNNAQQISIAVPETQYAHELETCRLILEHRDKEITWLKERIEVMAEMIVLLKQHR